MHQLDGALRRQKSVNKRTILSRNSSHRRFLSWGISSVALRGRPRILICSMRFKYMKRVCYVVFCSILFFTNKIHTLSPPRGCLPTTVANAVRNKYTSFSLSCAEHSTSSSGLLTMSVLHKSDRMYCWDGEAAAGSERPNVQGFMTSAERKIACCSPPRCFPADSQPPPPNPHLTSQICTQACHAVSTLSPRGVP